MFLGTFWASDTSMNATPVASDTTEYFEISNGVFDDVYMDADTDLEFSTEIPEWGYSTILHAQFKGDILAGNVDFTLAMISAMLIKRRVEGSYNWVTIYKQDIDSEEDFDFSYNDIVVASNTHYDYAAVPVIAGAEGTYQLTSVDVKFDGGFIVDPTKSYQVIANLSRPNLTRNNPSSILEPINSKYAHVNYYSISQYDRFTLTGLFAALNRNNCEFDFESSWKYRKEVRDFLTNRRSKIVKLEDGQIYMAAVVDPIQESIDGHEYNVITTVNFVEVGDVNNGSDLYYHGFTDFLEAGV